jgi:hypothetical protein
MTLSQKQLKDVCMINSGSKTCRYLYNDELDSSKWYCQKMRPIEKNKIDISIESFVIDCKKRKINPKSVGRSLGDNCEGFLLLKNIKQGYDV